MVELTDEQPVFEFNQRYRIVRVVETTIQVERLSKQRRFDVDFEVFEQCQ